MNQIFDVDINIMDNINLDIIENIEVKCKNKQPLSENEVLYFLSYVSYKVRKMLAQKKGIDINNYNFAGDCTNAQAMLGHYFDDLGIENSPVQTNRIFFNVLQHSFIIAHFLQNDSVKSYIVDPTYNQFFDIDKCLASNFIIKDGRIAKTPYPGYFILNEPKEKQEIIKKFLKYGFMELNREDSIIYGDSFYFTQIGLLKSEYNVLSSLNGLYLKFFLKNNFKVSKTKEELKRNGLLLKPVKTVKNFKSKRV